MRLLGAEGGAAAVEFALIAIPFLMLLFGIIELALLFILSTSLDNASATVARTIRTGQLQTSGAPSAESFRKAICDNLGWLESDCQANLRVDVRTFDTFADVVLTNPVTDSKLPEQNQLMFDPGGAGDIVLVRAYYPWTLISPSLSKAAAPLEGGKALVTTSLTFRNEPYN